MTTDQLLSHAPLGKETVYITEYAPELLFPIARNPKRQLLGIQQLPFHGVDIWNAFEISWLNLKGKPEVACAEFRFPCTSPNLIESKSFKLYLNSFNQTKVGSIDELKAIISEDLSQAAQANVAATLTPIHELKQTIQNHYHGILLDSQDVTCSHYHVEPKSLTVDAKLVEETLYSHLLKSNCPVTGQPDWASIFIHYHGPKIHHEGLLQYLVSFRCHDEFHEQCVERIFADLSRYCKPQQLTVYARYTRRGGLDINPFRSNFEDVPENIRLVRQ